MDLKLLKWINWSDRVLPHVAHNVIEIASFEHINGIRRNPKLHVDVAHRLILPIRLVRFQLLSDGVILVLSGQTSVFSCLLGPPFAESSGFEVVYFSGPVPRHIDLPKEGPEFVVVSILPPEEREGGFDGSYPPLSFFGPQLWPAIASFVNEL
jgi:hypothetical protein